MVDHVEQSTPTSARIDPMAVSHMQSILHLRRRLIGGAGIPNGPRCSRWGSAVNTPGSAATVLVSGVRTVACSTWCSCMIASHSSYRIRKKAAKKESIAANIWMTSAPESPALAALWTAVAFCGSLGVVPLRSWASVAAKNVLCENECDQGQSFFP